MRKIKLLLFSLLALVTTHAQTLSYRVSGAGTINNGANVVVEINGYITTSQQKVEALFDSNIFDGNWTGTANYDYYVNNTLVASSTNPSLSVNLSAYIPITSVKIVSKATHWTENWSNASITLTVTPTVALTSGPTVSNVSYIKNTTASPLTATLTGGNTSLKWYTSILGEGYSTTPPTPSTSTVGTTTYYVAQANSSGVESARSAITVTINPIPAPIILYWSSNLYTFGTEIANLIPLNFGGAVPGSGSYIYSVSPALPGGLSINATTGVISGTPTQVTAATNYTITATNEGGSSSAVITIRVKAQAPNISYASPKLYTVGTAITNLTPTNTGGAVPGTDTYIYGVSPALPSGLSINATTGVINGTPTQVTAATDYTITATNESGSSSAIVNIRVKDKAPIISYATPHLYTVGTVISTLTPTNTGGQVPGTSTYIYTISPSLPAGLTISAATGDINGTPTQLTAATNYTITATNESGSNTAIVNIRVTSLAPSISYSTPNQYTLGTEIVPLSPINLGGEVPAGVFNVSVLAGGTYGMANGTGAQAQFSYPYGIDTDAAGNVYVADQYSHSIRKISPEGVVTTLAGNGLPFVSDGTGAAAGFNTPVGVAVDANGNVFVAEQYSNTIRKITAEGVTTTFAGSGLQGLTDDTGTAAQFNQPTGVAVDAAGNVYVADFMNNAIRKISSAGVVTTLAGGTQGAANGTGTEASFNAPIDLAVDADGNVFVADQVNNLIRKITPAGVVTTFAGNTAENAYNDGIGIAASFNYPTSISFDASGNMYVADQYNYRIRKITPDAVVTTIAGDGTDGLANGSGLTAKFSSPVGVAVDGNGNLYVSDLFNNNIRKIVLLGYSISPKLPEGLIFDIATGAITGTPTEEIPATNFTITATNEYGTHSTVISISVNLQNGISIENADEKAIKVYATADRKIVFAGVENANVSVFNQIGQQLFNAKINSGIIQQSFMPGIYIVRVNKSIRKLILR